VEHLAVLIKAELQRLRSLREKKHRETLGLFVVEGEKVVAELLAADFPFIEIYATPEWAGMAAAPPGGTAGVSPAADEMQAGRPRSQNSVPPAHGSAVRAIPITAGEMARISQFPTPSSVLAVGKISRSELAPRALERGLTLALDGVQDAGNVGTLLRIADWFALDRVVMSPDCADLFSQKVINASMGSFARMPSHRAELAPLLGELAAASPGTPIIGCDLEGDDVHTMAPLSDAVVVIGSEGRGIFPAVAAHLTRRVTIPRFGRAESLNAAVAAAIVCDNLRRACMHPR
jgi:RNA methyltransferase, TrmH family